MTELLQRVIAKLEKLPEDEQNAIATRLLAELEDEQAWKVRFEATTDDQWDSLAQMVRREIAAGDVTPLADVIAIRRLKCIGKLEATPVLLNDLFYGCRNYLSLRYPQS